MPFTDDDLKRLKAECYDRIWPPNEVGTIVFQVNHLKSLLARLEAAEKLSESRCLYMELPQDEFDTSDGDGPILYEAMKEDEKAWRQAAGRS